MRKRLAAASALLPRAPAAACPQLAKGDIRAHSRAPDRGTGFDRAAKLAAIPAGEGRDYGPAPTCLRLEELNAGIGDALFFLRRQSLSQI